MKSEIKQKRRAIFAEIDRLNRLAATGVNVEAQLLSCGRQLGALESRTLRTDVMDVSEQMAHKALLAKAKANGITYQAWHRRVYHCGWDEERAATEPIKRTVPVTNIGINVAEYRQLKEIQNLTDENIRKAYGISQHMLHRFKRENNLLGLRQKVGVK